MNKTIGLQLIVYSLLLAGLSYLVHYLAPALARPTLITGLAGGLLCLVWGVRAIQGNTGIALPILTLVPVNFTLLAQTVITWAGEFTNAPGHRAAAGVISLLLLLSLGMMIRIASTSITVYGQAASPAKGEGNKPNIAGKPTIQANSAKRA